MSDLKDEWASIVKLRESITANEKKKEDIIVKSQDKKVVCI